MRVLLIEGTYSMEEVVAVLRDEYEGKGFDIPKRIVPDFVLKLAQFWDKEVFPLHFPHISRSLMYFPLQGNQK